MPSLILFSREELFTGESEFINQMMSLGNFNLHLRKKSAGERDLRKLLIRVNADFHPRIIIHQQFHLEKEFPLGGIHLPEKERIQYNQLSDSGHRIISTSIHSLSDYDSLRKNYSYIFFSPVFPSISKGNYEPSISTAELITQLNSIPNKNNLMALGGIDASTLKTALEMGFAGAGVLGSVWNARNPVKYLQDLITLSSGESR